MLVCINLRTSDSKTMLELLQSMVTCDMNCKTVPVKQYVADWFNLKSENPRVNYDQHILDLVYGIHEIFL